MNRLVPVFIIAGCSALVSCSGSSSDAVINLQNRLSGNFTIHQVGENAGGVYTTRVYINSSGNGTGSFTLNEHSQGDTAVNEPFTYSVSADNTFTVSTGTHTDYGIISADGSLFLIVDAELTGDPEDTDSEIIASVGMSTDCATAPVLSGDYQLGQIMVDLTGSPVVYTSLVDITIGATNSFTIVQHSDPAVVGQTGDFTYSINNDCSFTIDNGGAELQYGVASADGTMFAIVDADTTDSEIKLAVGIQKSSGMNNSSMAGNFWLNQFSEDNATATPLPFTAQVDVNSAGDGTGTATINRHSLGAAGAPLNISYSIAANGTFTVDNSVDTDSGILNPAGNFFLVVDTDHGDTDNEITLALGIKK